MNYLTDTSVVSPMMNGEARLTRRLSRLVPTDLLYTSVVTEAEIEFGLLLAGQLRSAPQRQNLVTTFAMFVDVLPINREVATVYATVKHSLRLAGKTIPDNDMWIAAVAMSNGMTVAHRDKHFSFVPGLSQEDWTD